MNDEKNSVADKRVVSTGRLEGKLTPEQIENWRNVLLGMIGPYALIMPAEQVQAMRDKFQEQANSLPSNAAVERLAD
jgi:hypothetical protein